MISYVMFLVCLSELLETCRLTSVVVHIRLCYVYTKQIEDVHGINLLYYT